MKKNLKTKKVSQVLTSTASVLIALGALMTIATSCGTETGNPVIKRPTTPRNIAQDAVESDMLELSEAIGDQESSSTALALSSSDKNTLLLADSNECSGTATNAITSVTRSKSKSKNFTKRGYSVSFNSERKTKTEWTSPLGALTCSGGTLKKTIRLLSGTVENRTGSIQRILSRTSSGRGLASSDYTRAEFLASGSWKRTFDRIEASNGIVTVSKTSEWSLNKSISLTTSEGESAAESSSGTVEGFPLKITVVREGLSETSKTIESGKTKSTRKDGSIVELTYESVVFSSTDICYPSKGKVQGRVTPAPSFGDNPQQFEIDFSKATDEIPEIVFSDGQKVSLSGACFD